MDDLKILHDAWGTPEAPSHAVVTRARAALLTRIAAETTSRDGSSVGRRLRLARPAAVGGLALAIAAGLIVADLGSTGSDGEPESAVPGLRAVANASAAVLERAAVAAETKSFTAPRDDQWVYIEDRFSTSGGETETRRQWRRADGRAIASMRENGTLEVELAGPPSRPGRPSPALGESYKELTALPTDPDALLRWAYGQAKKITGSAMNEDGDVYLLFNAMLRGNVLPPDLEAGIFRALKQIPGVSVETIDVFGRPALSLGLRTSDWLYEELLLDPSTYAYRGERSTVAKDATIDPLKAGNSTGEVTKGSRVVVERVATAIVDNPGQRN
jgi:hypothetical protein